MQIKGPLVTGTSTGKEIEIPGAVECFVPDLFSGKSNCLLDLASSGNFKAPKSVTFLTVSNIDASTTLGMCLEYTEALRFFPN